jgi:hypothetical protein
MVKKIAPKKLDVEGIVQALANAMIEFTVEVKDDFEKTTATWEHPVTFSQEVEVGPNKIVSSVLTIDQIYAWVDKGTEGHFVPKTPGPILRFQGGYKAKSMPNVIGSTAGGSFGPFFFSKGHWVKGIEPRNFDKAIAEKMTPIFKQRMQAAMKQAAKASGHAI